MGYDFWGGNFGGKTEAQVKGWSAPQSTPSKPSTTTSALSSALSKSSGGSSGGGGSSYSEHVSWFGSPEKYASAINDALNSGKQLSDQAAATSFQKDNPQLFGGIVPGGGGATPAPSYNSGAASGGGSKTGSIGNNSAALIDALKNIGTQFGSASPAGQTALNTQANDARSAFIQAGGNLQDVPTNLWGSDPSQGFQTGMGAFAGSGIGNQEAMGLTYNTGPANTVGGIGTRNLQEINRLYGDKTGQWWDTAETATEGEDWINMVGQDAWKAMGSPNVSAEAFGNTALWAMTGGKGNPPVPDEALNRIATGLNTGTLSPAAESLKKAFESYMPVEIPIEQQPIDFAQQIQSIYSQFQIDNETAPIYEQKFNELMSQIDSVESNYMDQLNKFGSGIDPATRVALASLKDTVNEQRKYLQEEMNSRGLLQSGIYLNEIDQRINKNELSETQKLLGQRLSDIQNQISNALLSFGNTRIQATSQYGLAAQQAAEAAAQRKQQATTNLSSALMKALEMSQKQKADAATLAWDKEKAMLPWTQGPTQAQMLPFQYPSANTVYTHDNPSADAQMKQSQWETEWPWKEAQYKYDLGKPYYKPETSRTKTSDADIKRENLADAQSSIWNKLNQGKSIQEVEAAIMANAGEYSRQGLNIKDLIDYAWYSSTGATKPKQENDSTAALTAALIKAFQK